MIIWIVALLGVGALWIMLWFARLSGWNPAPRGGSLESSSAWSVSVVIPARNEESNVQACLEGFRGQGDASLQLLVVDDGSTDATESRVRTAQKCDSRIQLIHASSRSEGWSGKTWALTEGVKATTGEWLLFCDADTVVAGDALQCAQRRVEDENLDCLSIIPQMVSTRVSVSMLVAGLALARAIFFRPTSPGNPGMTQGAFLVVRRSAFESVGGFSAVRGSLLEDVEFGSILCKSGFKVCTLAASSVIRTTMYASFPEAWAGICKFAYPVMGYSGLRVLTSTAVCMGMVFFPLVSLFVGVAQGCRASPPQWSMAMAIVSFVVTALMYAVMGRVVMRESLRPEAVPLLPVSLCCFGALAVHSIYAYRYGRVTGKGRQYEQHVVPLGSPPEDLT